MGIMKQFAIMTGLKPREDAVGEHILAMQYEHLKKHIPLLYLTISFYFAMAVIFLISHIPVDSVQSYIARYVLPAIIIPFSLIRGVIWYHRRQDKFEREKVEKTIISLTIISASLSMLCGYWSILAWQADIVDRHSYLALIMAMGGFSVAYCLSIIPFSAAFNLVAVLLPLNLVLIFSGETFLIAVAVTVLTAMVYLIALLRRHYNHMVRMIELQVQMHDLANTDILTGLLNRRALIEEYAVLVYGESNSLVSLMENEDDTEIGANQPDFDTDTMIVASEVTHVTMVMLDLDGFKPINDKYGHATGDKLLQMIAARMKKHISDYGTIARIGGDEFAILFVNKPVQFCIQMIESLSYILSSPYIIDDEEKKIGISFGFAHRDENIGTIEKLLSKADAELYDMKAKKYDKNHIEDEVIRSLNIIQK